MGACGEDNTRPQTRGRGTMNNAAGWSSADGARTIAFALSLLLLRLSPAAAAAGDQEAAESGVVGRPQGNHSSWSRSGGYSSVVTHGAVGDSEAASSSASFVSGGLTVQDPPKGWPFSEVTIHLPAKGQQSNKADRKPTAPKRYRKPRPPPPALPTPAAKAPGGAGLTHQVVHAHMFAPAPPPSPAPLTPATPTRRPEAAESSIKVSSSVGNKVRAGGARSQRGRDQSFHVGYSIGFSPEALRSSKETLTPAPTGDIVHGRPSASGETPRLPRMNSFQGTSPATSAANSRASSYSVANFYQGGTTVSHAVAHDDDEDGEDGSGRPASVTRVKVKQHQHQPLRQTTLKHNSKPWKNKNKNKEQVSTISTASLALGGNSGSVGNDGSGGGGHHVSQWTPAHGHGHGNTAPEQSAGESMAVASPLQSVVRDHALFVHHGGGAGGGSDSHHKKLPLRSTNVVHHPSPNSGTTLRHHGNNHLNGGGLRAILDGGEGGGGGGGQLGMGSVLTSLTPYPLMSGDSHGGSGGGPKAYLATLSGAGGGGGAVPALVIPMSHLQSLAAGPLPVVATGGTLLAQPPSPTTLGPAAIMQGHSLPMATLATGFKSFVPTLSTPASKPPPTSPTKSHHSHSHSSYQPHSLHSPHSHHHHNHHGPSSHSVQQSQPQGTQFTRLVLNQGHPGLSSSSGGSILGSSLGSSSILNGHNNNNNHHHHQSNTGGSGNSNNHYHHHSNNHYGGGGGSGSNGGGLYNNLNNGGSGGSHSHSHNHGGLPNNVINSGGILMANNDGFRLNNVVPYVPQSHRPRNNGHRGIKHATTAPLFNMKDLGSSSHDLLSGSGHKGNGGGGSLLGLGQLQGSGLSSVHGSSSLQNLQSLSSNLQGLTSNLQGLNLQGYQGLHHGVQGLQGLASNAVPGSIQPLQTLQVASPALKQALQAQGLSLPSTGGGGGAGSLRNVLPSGSSPMPIISLSDYLKMTTAPHTFGGSPVDFSQDALRQLMQRQNNPVSHATQGVVSPGIGGAGSGTADMQRALAAYNSMLSVALFSTARPHGGAGGGGGNNGLQGASSSTLLDLRPPPPRSHGL